MLLISCSWQNHLGPVEHGYKLLKPLEEVAFKLLCVTRHLQCDMSVTSLAEMCRGVEPARKIWVNYTKYCGVGEM